MLMAFFAWKHANNEYNVLKIFTFLTEGVTHLPKVPLSLMGPRRMLVLLASLSWCLALNVVLQSPSSGSHVILKRTAFSGYVSGMATGARLATVD